MPAYSAPEGRHSKRNAARKRVTLIVDLEGRREKIPCLITDISEEGIRLRGNLGQLKSGRVVEIESNEGPPYIVRCRVIWLGKPGSKQEGEAGLQLLNPLLDLGNS